MTKAERAEKVYRTLSAYLDRQKLKYEHDDAERSLTLTLTGKVFPITVYFRVEAEYERTYIFSRLPFKPKQQLPMIMAVNDINRVLAVGAFCMDAESDSLSYESTELFTGLDGFNAAYAERLLMTPFSAVEAYVDKLYDLNEGNVGIGDFAKSL